MTYEIKEYQTKKRQGEYIRVKGQGLPSHYYKYERDIPPETYEQYVTDRYINKAAKGTIYGYKKASKGEIPKEYPNLKRTTTRMFKRMTATKNALELVNKGITHHMIPDISDESDAKINQRIEQMLHTVVKYKPLAKILAQESNMQQLKSQMDYEITIYGENNAVLAEVSIAGEKTPREVRQDMNEIIRRPFDMRDFSNIVRPELQQRGYDVTQHFHKGQIFRIQVVMALRKDG